MVCAFVCANIPRTRVRSQAAIDIEWAAVFMAVVFAAPLYAVGCAELTGFVSVQPTSAASTLALFVGGLWFARQLLKHALNGDRIAARTHESGSARAIAVDCPTPSCRHPR